VKGRNGYQLVPHDGLPEDKSGINIDIYEGNLNAIGSSSFALSAGWYKNPRSLITVLKNNLYNYTRNITKSKSGDVLWTCYKNAKEDLKKGGGAKGFAPCNIRATNDYKERTTVAYCVNMFMRPVVKNYFVSLGVTVDEDGFALSEMIQFLWRSALREGKEIKLYIPSKRMRNLLKDWLGSSASLAKQIC
jgi:hypothetical protein